ncbi:hypothetical protein TWF718_007807 [Orbilia javanica]|uniref:BTB domain-containing protein n=1 Tax=Orbilia javanica TaxID=47235 RepID=A0AAN8MP69_9PEZI
MESDKAQGNLELSVKTNSSSELDADKDRDQPVTLLRMYHNPKFSDIKVFAGEDQRCFDLHRVVLVAHSKYFAIACKAHFEEGIKREVSLPEIPPKAFEAVALWMYGGDYTYPQPFKVQPIQEVFMAADYLQILPLKNHIINRAKKYFQDGHVGDYDIYNLLETFCKHSGISDWGKLRPLAELAVHNCYIPARNILRLSKAGSDSSMMLGLIIEAYQNEYSTVLCSPCQIRHKPADKASCSRSGCKMVCADRDYVKPIIDQVEISDGGAIV